MTEDEQQPFSEDAALRELEDLHRAIEATRVRRKDANDAFDRFLRSFDRRPAAAPAPEPPPAPKSVPVATPADVPAAPPVSAAPVMQPAAPVPVPAPIAPVQAPAVGPVQEVAPPQHIVELTPATVLPPIVEAHPPDFPSERPHDHPEALDLDNWEQETGVSAFPEESDRGRELRPVPSALAMPVRRSRRIPPAALAAAVLLIVAVAFFALRRSDDTGRTDAVATETPTPAPQPAPQPAPVATPPPRAEIATSRQVWIRVIVDGKKVIERELPPNTRIPLNPAAQFVVRAGDAGAVRIAIGGKDQGPVGPDGQAVTKAFTVPPKADR